MRRGLWLASAVSLLIAGEASAFECTRSKSAGYISLRWAKRELQWAIRSPGSTQVAPADVIAMAEAGFKAWAGKRTIDDRDGLGCTDIEFTMEPVVPPDTKPEVMNQVAFLADAWPHKDASVLALTTMTHNTSDGIIKYGIIEVNEALHEFTDATASCTAQFDLGAVLTHEIGHFLGLHHTQAENVTGGPEDPTMTASVTFCDTRFRSLARDDIDAVCFLYPKGGQSNGCATLPDQGNEPYVTGLPFGCAATRAGDAWTLLGAVAWLTRRRSRIR